MSAMRQPCDRVRDSAASNRLSMIGIGVPPTGGATIRARTGGAGR
jgi:hypothetical protein